MNGVKKVLLFLKVGEQSAATYPTLLLPFDVKMKVFHVISGTRTRLLVLFYEKSDYHIRANRMPLFIRTPRDPFLFLTKMTIVSSKKSKILIERRRSICADTVIF